LTVLAAVPLACGFSAAQAQQPVDNYETVALSTGDYSRAIPALEARLRADPTNESLLLNLAMAYRKSGEAAKADLLYKRVLFQEDVVLNGAGGVQAWSHDLAKAGMALNRPR
jgi:Flp pilus assembly protein TadD